MKAASGAAWGVSVVIPTYRAASSIIDVVAKCLEHADLVIVVDDACPERSGDLVTKAYEGNPRVLVLLREQNGGVGAAMKTGIREAINLEADVIVKVDADGQMDPSFIPTICRRFADDPSLMCIKGNRFFDSRVLSLMPKGRLLGNAVLSLLAKGASGYWNVIDPTNGFLAFNARLLRALPWESFADSYFFELSVLCEFGLRRMPLLELEIPTIYTAVPSSLSVSRVIIEFPPKLARYALRRLLLQYFVLDVNLATLYLLVGSGLTLFGLIFGSFQWVDGLIHHVEKPLGIIMLAALPFGMGFQLLINAMMFDVQFSPRTQQELIVAAHRRSLVNLHRGQP